MTLSIRPRGHAVAILFSERSRSAYAAQARAAGETYTFTDAWGEQKTWLKGAQAYLAPNAASLFLARCNLKHDLIEEDDLGEAVLSGLRLLMVPNAAHLAEATIARIEVWLAGDAKRCLIASGRTNLPPALLGLSSLSMCPTAGFTGWRWLAGSPFTGEAWEKHYVSGGPGHAVCLVAPTAGARVLAELLEFSGDLSESSTAAVAVLGPGIVAGPQTLYFANQVFEFIGGMLQAHTNVEAVRHWSNPTHWGDTLLFFMRQLVRDAGQSGLWETRLRSFGAYRGVLSFRHDVHGMRDYSMLDYQIQNLVPASYDIEDPAFSTNITEPMAADWIARTSRNSFIEPALHNDSSIGDPPTAVVGKGLFEHVFNAGRNLGVPICTCGRHAGGHMHPETIDAMDYLYARDAQILGLCTFCYYHMIEYGVRDPQVMVGGEIGGKPLTYVTDVRRTISTQGIWFPFHAVVTTDVEWRPLRGWDRTHEYDAAYELVETIYGAHNALVPGVDDQLENGVYSFQYHPELSQDPSLNDGRGTLDYVRYAINLAERNRFWIASQRDLYQRMGDYEDLVFTLRDGGRTVTVANPGPRTIEGLMVEQRLPFASVREGGCELVHVVDGAFVTVPPLAPGRAVTLEFGDTPVEAPILRQPCNRGLEVLDARGDPSTGETTLLLRVCRAQPLRVEGVHPEGVYRVQVDDEAPMNVAVRTTMTIQKKLSRASSLGESSSLRAQTPGVTRFLDLMLEGHPDNFVVRRVRIRRLAEADEKPARVAIIMATPKRTGRVV